MTNQPDDDLWELLDRADAAMAEEPPCEDDPEDDYDDIPLDPEQFGEEPVIYRNFSNGYGRDFQAPAQQWDNYNNRQNRQPSQMPPQDPLPQEPPVSQPPQQPRKLTQAQKAAQSAPIRAYNADFVKNQEPRFTAARKEPRPVLSREPVREPAPEPLSQPPQEPAPKPRKRRRFRFGCLTAVLVPVLLIALVIGIFNHYVSPPRSDVPIGSRKPGTSAILLCGADVGGVRTDTMMILYVDSVKKESGLLSLPRDTYGQTAYGLNVKLNSAYGRNDCGEAGMKVLLDYVQDILGYRPDGYLLVELPLLRDLVDLMGGVSFQVPTTIDFSDSDMDLDVHLEPGMQHLDGTQALGLVRFRYGYVNQDLGRADTQKAFLKACMQQWVSRENLNKLPQILDLFRENSLNSLDTGNYLWFGVNLIRCGLGNLRTDTLPGYATYIGDQSFYVLYPEEVVELVNEHYNPYKQDITMDDVHIRTEG